MEVLQHDYNRSQGSGSSGCLSSVDHNAVCRGAGSASFTLNDADVCACLLDVFACVCVCMSDTSEMPQVLKRMHALVSSLNVYVCVLGKRLTTPNLDYQKV